MKHALDTDLALYATGDLNWWAWLSTRLHVARCAVCLSRVEAHRFTRVHVRELAAETPAGVAWDRLAAEMAANIRVGLAAGECVTPRASRRSVPMGWRVAGVSAGFTALLISAWWINMPASQTASLGRAMKAIAQGRTWPGRGLEAARPLVRASAAGIELRENGGTLVLSGAIADRVAGEGPVPGPARPASVTLNVQGSARAHYVDSETGQVTIMSVYAQ